MAEITIRFRHDKDTGKRELVIHLESDSDVLGHEHERDHRQLVEALIGQKIDEDTGVVIERVEKDRTALPRVHTEQRQRQAGKNKG